MLKSDLFKKCVPAICIVLISAAVQICSAKDAISHLQKRGDATQLVVGGKPFLILGGELGNSSASSLDYMVPIWPKLVQMNLNTVLAPVYWELIEPEEGKFEFALVDGLIAGARRHNMRLVLLWFGSWKNSMSCYAPQWVKTDQQRFPRARLQNGKAMEILSAFNDENCDADARAFAALMKYLRKVDEGKRTVIMVQVENEIGMLTDARDHSDAANLAFNQQVPSELTAYLSKNKDSLATELKEIWKSAGNKTAGSWEEVFGKSIEADEIFMAWQYARYTNKVAEAGKAEYPLPMFVNAALIRPNYKPGQYPSAGPLPHLFDIWRAGAPQIEFFSPDIYFPEFEKWSAKYHVDGNPLFIPEAGREAEIIIKAFYAFGRHDAIGFCPFSIESIREPDSSTVSKVYGVLSQLAPLILEKQGSGQTAGVILDEGNQTQDVNLGRYTLNISHSYTFKWSRPAKVDIWPVAGGIVICTGPDEYVVAGSGLIVTFAPNPPGEEIAGIVNIQEGNFVNGRWIGGRWLNGDQNHQGRHLNLPLGNFGIQRIKLYRYR